MNVEPGRPVGCPRLMRRVIERVRQSPMGSRLARGFFWSLAGSVISRGLMLAASVCVARIMGQIGFGELGMLQTTVGMFGIFAESGLGLTATKHVAEYRQSDPKRAGRIISIMLTASLVIGSALALCLFCCAPWLAEHAINAPHMAHILRISAAMVLITVLNSAQSGSLSGFEAFRTLAYINLFSGLASFPILILGAWLGGLEGAVWALVINLAIGFILNQRFLKSVARRNGISFGIRFFKSEMSLLWTFSLPAILAGSLVAPVNWICSAILVNRPGGYGEMAILNATNQWFYMLLFLPRMLGQVLLPVLSERFGQRDAGQSLKTITLAMKVNGIVVLPMVIIGSLLSEYVMGLYGEEFRSGWLTLTVVLMTTGLVAIQTPVGHMIAASGKMWVGFTMNFGWAIVFVLATLLLVDKGALGLATARGVAYAVHSIWTFAFVYRFLRLERGNHYKA